MATANFYAVNLCAVRCVLIVVMVVTVTFVGSVPVSVSPKAFRSAGELKSQIVLITLVSFFDLLFFMAFSFCSKLSGHYSSLKFITRRGICCMQRFFKGVKMT